MVFTNCSSRTKEGGEWVVFDAYVDSGAAYSIFHVDVAKVLGIDVEGEGESFVVIGDGSGIRVYIHSLKSGLRMKNSQPKSVSHVD